MIRWIGAADPIALDVGHGQALGHHTLAGEGGVAVDEDRQPRVRPGRIDLVLPGPHHPEHDRIDRLQVARVGGQLHLDVRAGRAHVLADRAEVVLDVARALDGCRVHVALELTEDLVVALADDVGEHVQPAAVGHAEDRAVDVRVGGRRQHGVQDGDGRLRTFETEALGADVLGGQEPLQRLGGVEPLEQVLQRVGVELELDTLHLRLDPALLLRVLDVHVLDADRAAVGVAQHAQQRPERMRSLPATPPVRNSRSRSQIVRP